MRKNYQMWLLGALFGGLVLPFAGCSNEDDPISNEQGNGEKYNAEFAVMLSRGNTTKASTDEVGEGAFQGMTNIRLIGFNNTGVVGSTDLINTTNYYVSGTQTFVDMIDLSDMNQGVGVSKYLYPISLEKESQSFLFYGESLTKNGNSGIGQLNASYLSGTALTDRNTPQDIDFSLEALTTTDAQTDITAMETYLQNVINVMADNVKVEMKASLAAFFANCTSPSIYQVAYMLDQLYFNTSMWVDGQQSTVQSAITNNSSAVFDQTELASALASLSDAGDLFAVVDENKANYLGDYYPIGGMKLVIDLNTKSVDITASNTYYRPTSLYYMANSFLVAYTDYDDLSWATGGTSNQGSKAVDLATESPTQVALYDQIQYAVGQLYLDFKIDSKSIDDNLYGLNGTGGIDPNKIKLKGILINNQKEVGWEFLPANTFATDLAYDNSVNNAGTGGAVTANMLALPTKVQEPVTVVLELENTSGTAFEGVNSGIIPGYATFYAIATLNPKAASTLPEGVDRAEDLAVFMSDYKTTATLTLASLEDSYNTVPDLTDANLQFALSVDLTWKAGVNYDIIIGGED